MRYVDIDKPRYVRYTDERGGEVVTSEQTIAEILDGSIGLIDEEIVRCKDCKYRDDDDFCTGRGYPNALVPDDGFCDKGRRE